MTVTPQPRITSIDTGKFIVIADGHASACRVYEEGDAWRLERRVRVRLTATDLSDMARSSSIFRVEPVTAVQVKTS